MAWIGFVFTALMAVMAIDVGSPSGFLFALVACALIAPFFWPRLIAVGHNTYRGGRIGTAIVALFAAIMFNGSAHSNSPEGRAAAAQRVAQERQEAEQARAQARREEAETTAQREAEVASGEHCLSGWDGSFRPLKSAVEMALRNPRSFEHVSTVRTPVDENGTFGLIMTYRAENGFGGMNVEAAGIEIEARTCDWRQVNTETLTLRLSD